MVKALTKVVYKPSTQSTDEFTVIVNQDEYKRWKEGDTTIPLVEVVDSYQVFFSNQGTQGILGQASKQQLENIFGTHRDDEVVKQILEKGQVQAGEGIKNGGAAGSTNIAIGSATIDSRGKGRSGI